MLASDDVRHGLAHTSRAMLNIHDRKLSALRVKRWDPSYRVEALASVVRRQQGLKRVDVEAPEAIPALVHALAEGCLCHVQELFVAMDPKEALAPVELLAGAMQVPGALQALEILRLAPAALSRKELWQIKSEEVSHPGMLPCLAEALASGASPGLRILDLKGFRSFQDKDLVALTTMLMTRARLHVPLCRGLEQILSDKLLSDDRSTSTSARARLLRALLPSVTELTLHTWNSSYETCFVTGQPAAPRLKEFTMTEPGSLKMWESMPELEGLSYYVSGHDDIRSLVEASNSGAALRQLNDLRLGVRARPEDWDLVLNTLAGASCASQLTSFGCEDLPLTTMAILSSLLGQNTFPKLQELCFLYNPDYGDDYFNALAQGLLAASHTRLTSLIVHSCSVGDEGMAALAGLVRAGRFKRLENIGLTLDATDSGVCLLAQAIQDAGEHGLPMLSNFKGNRFFRMQTPTGVGVKALASALIQNCPRLTEVDWAGWHLIDYNGDTIKFVHEMMHAANRDRPHRLRFKW